MKKILLILTFCASFSFALDVGSGANEDLSTKGDSSRNISDTQYVSESKSKSTSFTESDEKSKTVTNSLVRIEQTEPLSVIFAFERSGIEPFATCKLLSEPRYASDFGLSCYVKNTNMFNEGRCSSLDLAVKNNLTIKNFLGKRKAKKVMAYGECVGVYGAFIANSMKKGKTEIGNMDKEIKGILDKYLNNIQYNNCKLTGSTDTINCNGALFKIGYEPQAHFAGISLYSDKTFFGYSSTENVDNSKRVSESFSKNKSKNFQDSLTVTDSINNNTAINSNIQQQVSAGLSAGKFIPSE